MKIKLLTSVHIGTGEEIPLYEWKANNNENRWLRIDWLNLPLSLFPSEDVLRDFNKLKAWHRESFSWDIAYEHKVYEAQVASGISLPTEGREIFRECMKNQSTLEPIIPGSSLKGAILTGYLYWGYESQGKFELGPYGEKSLDNSVKEELRKFARGDNPVSEFSNRLKISDIAFPQSTLRVELAERRMKKTRHQWVECIAAESISTVTISFGSERESADVIAPQMRPLRKHDVKELVKRCNHFAKAVIQAEVEYYDYVKKHKVTLPNHYKQYGVDFVDKLPATECLVRLGWGSNKNAVSVVLLNSKPSLAYQPHPKSENYRPKSRWLLSGNTPPGWCLLKFETGDWME